MVGLFHVLTSFQTINAPSFLHFSFPPAAPGFFVKKKMFKLPSRDTKYYTPRTYGLEGLSYNGFSVDSIFVAGSNLFDPVNSPKTTWDLLKFHIKRSLLSAVHCALEYKIYGSPKPEKHPAKEPHCITEITDINDFELVSSSPDVEILDSSSPSSIIAYSYYLYTLLQTFFLGIYPPNDDLVIQPILTFFRKSQKKTVPFNGPSVAKRVTVVLTSHPFLAPPPPIIPDDTLSQTSKLSEKEIKSIKAKIEKYDKDKRCHAVSDLKRLLVDATDLVYQSTIASLDRLTIYESDGVLCQSSDMLARMVKKKFEAVSIGPSMYIPSIAFVLPSTRTRIELINGEISVIDARESSVTPNSPVNTAPSWILEVVLIKENDGKEFSSKVLKQVCFMVDQTLLKTEEVEKTLESVFDETYITPPAHLVITSGYTCEFQGVPPLNMRGSVF